MPQLYDLNRPCRTCGELLVHHVWSRCSCRIYLRPCDQRLALDWPVEWEEHIAPDGCSCVFCGEPLRDHFRFEVFAVRVMDRLIEDHREVSLQNAVEFSSCRLAR